ncbi:MAG: HPP family protein [Oligoflexus sp.]
MILAELLKDRQRKLISVGRDAHISFIYEVMKSNRIHHLAVINDHTFLGLVDQEAILDAIMISPLNFNSLEAQDIMRRHIPAVLPEHSIEDVVKLMKEKNLPALPYMVNGKCETLITRTDILKLVYEHALNVSDEGGDLLDKAIQRSDLAMTNPVVHRVTKLLADIGI